MEKKENIVETKENETEKEDTMENKTENKKEDIVVEAKGGKLKTILKWVGAGAALIATGLVGFLIGHNGDDDDDNTETKSEATEE